MIPEAREVRLRPKIRKVLEARCRAPSTPQGDLKRAQIVLLAAEGRSTRSIAKEVGVQPRIVSKWRHRFADHGLAGLNDRPRASKKPIYSQATNRRILALLDKPPPPGYARWTGRLLAMALQDVDVQYVWRFLREHNIDLAARKSWCESNDPEFAAKAGLISLIRRWLKAGVLEDGQVQPSEQGTPQGGSISVLLSNLYLHFVLDLWFERVVKRRLRGEARLVRYIDDFVICFQYRSDAIRVQEALRLRLGKFGLALEPTKTKLVEFGRFAQRHAGKRGRKRPETIYFLGLTLYCTRNLKGNFKVGMRTEKSRLRRSLLSLQELMRQIRHYTIGDQVGQINAVLRGHYAYYGVAGNLRCLVKVYRAVERYWRRILRSRSWAGRRLTWEKYHQIKARTPLLKPKLCLPYAELQALAVL